MGKVASDSGQTYIVRVANFERLSKSDIIAEYSRQNLYHLQQSGCFPELAGKFVVVPPMMNDQRPGAAAVNRDIPVVSTFGEPLSPRRQAVFDEMGRIGAPCRNVVGCYGPELLSMLRRSRIMLNLRQTDYHHAFEEIRVLPALLNGVVVVSEDIVLRDLVPYHKHIVWCGRTTCRACWPTWCGITISIGIGCWGEFRILRVRRGDAGRPTAGSDHGTRGPAIVTPRA